jgi:tRNA (uracil-5-)-methyltransferase TRM9
MTQRLLESVSPSHGRVLIYVWAIEQDEHSKRIVPVPDRETGAHADVDGEPSTSGQDVFVPWSLVTGKARSEVTKIKEARDTPETTPEVVQRYYHMFAKGELGKLVQTAAQEMGLNVGPPPMSQVEGVDEGVAVVASGWERSNYYIELWRWQR